MVELDVADGGTLEDVVRDWGEKIPALQVDAFAVQIKLYQINVITSRIYNRIADEFSLSDIDVSVLMIIRRERPDRPVRPSDLWRSLHMRPSAITYRVDRLHELGLVQRLLDENDRRAWLLKLTDEGLRVVNDIVLKFNKVTVERLAIAADHGCDIAALDRQLDCLLKAWNSVAN
ncbi:MarR family winged helix-turn-helix transcriptional regulator [Sphingobium nicotianae]|uniref:MarR family transcriptional regulator n=1 Tax=Sphingobium nicotianae TaxID=2782607 RepID=A0A9X1IRV1_9SPHN|nr:MarR family transcriptional regulator [Sphingobium nicotianae]MBT2187876.1 MarR family transcriptional regulator [Sphingobium nicotianae]